MDEYYDQHEEVLLDADARSARFFQIDEGDEKDRHVWHVRQTIADSDEEHDFSIVADVDLDATQDEGEVVFSKYRVGFVEDVRWDEEDA